MLQVAKNKNKYTNDDIPVKEIKNGTIILDNGMILELSENKIRILEDTIHVGDLLVDGIGVGDVGALVLAERQKLADDGVVCMSCGVSSVEKKAIAGPDIQMRGFVLVKDSESLIDKLKHNKLYSCDYDLKIRIQKR